mgnify:CR=1 FL=1
MGDVRSNDDPDGEEKRAVWWQQQLMSSPVRGAETVISEPFVQNHTGQLGFPFIDEVLQKPAKAEPCN